MVYYAKESVRLARLKTKYTVAESGCWEWIGSRNAGGYGTVMWHGKCQLAHRVSYVVLGGGKIPEGFGVLHRCDNRKCINPAHLFVGTAADNAADRDAKGRRRAPVGELNPNLRFTASDIARIRQLLAEGHTQVAVAAFYETSQGYISAVKRGRLWSSLPGHRPAHAAM